MGEHAVVHSYLTVGHVCVDELAAQSLRLGGTVFFAAAQAAAMGCDVRVVTSCTHDTGAWVRRELAPSIALELVDSATDTRFEFGTDAEQGPLRLQSVATLLDRLPPTRPDILHLAPVFNELSTELIESARDSAEFVGATPQGLLRGTDAGGGLTFVAANWPALTDFADAIVLNDAEFRQLGELGLLDGFGGWVFRTRGAAGATLYRDGVKVGRQAPPAATETSGATARSVAQRTIGAGDVFAAAAFVTLARGDDPRRALAVAVESATAYVRRSSDHPTYVDGSDL